MTRDPAAPACCNTPRRVVMFHALFWTLAAFAGFFALVRGMTYTGAEFTWGMHAGVAWRHLAFFGGLAALTLAFRRLPLGGSPVPCEAYAREVSAAAFTFFVLFFALFFVGFSERSPMRLLSPGLGRTVFWVLQASVLLVFAPRVVRQRALLPLVGFAVLSLWAFAWERPWLMVGFWPLALWVYFEFLKDTLEGLGFLRAGFVLAAGLLCGWGFARYFGAATEGWQWLVFLTPLLPYVFHQTVLGQVGLRPAPPTAWSFPWSPAALVGFFAVAAVVVFLPSVHAARTRTRAPSTGTDLVMEPFPHLRHQANGRLRIEVDSQQVPQAAGIKGYAGPLGVIVRFDEACTIESVRLGSHNETPSFVDKFTPWMGKFAGFPASRSVMDGIDTVSGATLSTQAIRHAVHEVRSRVCPEVLRIQTDTRLVRGPQASWHDVGVPAAFLVIALALWFLLLPAGRLAVLAASFVLLGVLHNHQLGLVDLGLATTGIFPTALAKTTLLVGALILAVLVGPLWCAFLCPAGAAQEWIHFLARRRGDWRAALTCDERPLDGKHRWVRAAGFIKYVLLAGALVGFALTLNQRFLSWDPLSILFALPPQSLQYYPIALAIAVSSVFQFRPWCRFLCPLGAAFLVLSKLAPLARFFPVRILPSCDFGATSARDLSCIRCQRCCRR